MKSFLLLLSQVFVAFVMICTPLKAAEKANPFIGSWQLVSGKYLDGKGQWVEYSDLKLSAIKVISASHFSFTTMKNVGSEAKPNLEFWAAATGDYEYSATDYIEYPHLNSFGVSAGESFIFTYSIEGKDWRTQRIEEGVLKEQEHWTKLD